MKRHHHFLYRPPSAGPCRRLARALTGVALLALLYLFPAPALATARVDRPIAPAVAAASGSLESPAAVNPLLASWLDTVLRPLELLINSRQRMVQVAALMMVLGLFIIWWRK